MGIVVIGCTFVDIKGLPLAPYIPAGRNMGRVETVHGGVCRNVAEDIANMGLHPTFISLVDESGTGKDVLDHLSASGCDVSHVKRCPNGMGTWLAVFDNSGDVVASISSRPDPAPMMDVLLQDGDAIFSTADSVVIEVDMDEDLVLKVLELAEKWHVRVYAVVSNMSIALNRRGLMHAMDCVVCNLQEAAILFSQKLESMDIDTLCFILPALVRAAGLNRMVVTMGGSGSIWIERDGSFGVCPAMKVDVQDTTGAGDSFFAGVTAGLTYGKTLEESCRIGTRLAAAVITTTENVCPRFRPEEFTLG